MINKNMIYNHCVEQLDLNFLKEIPVPAILQLVKLVKLCKHINNNNNNTFHSVTIG